MNGSSSHDGGGWMDAGAGMQLGLLGVTGWVSPTLAAPEADLSDSSSSSRGGGGGSGARVPGRGRGAFALSSPSVTPPVNRRSSRANLARTPGSMPDKPRMTRTSMHSTSLVGVNRRCSEAAARHVDIPRAYCRTAEEREGSLESDRACCSTKGRPTTRG